MPKTTPAVTRWQVATTAAKYIGTKETPAGSNRTKFWEKYYPAWQGSPWCGAFVHYVLAELGVAGKPSDITRIFYTPAIVADARSLGWWRDDSSLSQAKPGDLVLFDFDGTGNAKHVGFIEKMVGNGVVQTIEGNTSPGVAGSQNDGGGVYRRWRDTKTVMGYVDMGAVLLERAPSKAPSPSSGGRDWSRVLLKTHGQWTSGTVSRLQAEVGVKVDGVLGPQTRRAVQRWLGVTQDGVWGKKTIAALQAKVGVKKPTGRMTPTGVVKPLQRWLNDNRPKK